MSLKFGRGARGGGVGTRWGERQANGNVRPNGNARSYKTGKNHTAKYATNRRGSAPVVEVDLSLEPDVDGERVAEAIFQKADRRTTIENGKWSSSGVFEVDFSL
jgi:hypothetical protein